jgi:hypothetical protein
LGSDLPIDLDYLTRVGIPVEALRIALARLGQPRAFDLIHSDSRQCSFNALNTLWFNDHRCVGDHFTK